MTNTLPPSPYLTPAQAAAYIGVPEKRLLRWAAYGKIEKIKLYDGQKFTVEALDRFMSDRTVRVKK